MAQGHCQTLLYLIGGSLLILTAVFVFRGITLPSVVGMILLVIGIMILILTQWVYRVIDFPSSLAFFLIGLTIFGVAGSGYAQHATLILLGRYYPYSAVRYELAAKHTNVTELNLNCALNIGNIQISFTDDETIVYAIAFTHLYFASFSQRVWMDFKNTIENDQLDVKVLSSGIDIKITIGPHVKLTAHLSTMLGAILVESPVSAEIREMKLQTMDGNVIVHLYNISSLGSFWAEAKSGSVKMALKAPSLRGSPIMQVETVKGNIDLNIIIGERVGCEVTAKTELGNIKVDALGFDVIKKTGQYCMARSCNYLLSEQKISLTAYSNNGNIGIDAKITGLEEC